MRKSANIRDRLVPLRYFVIPGLYSNAYLSVLVQRKRLKARKIGRNYFTSQDWFENYLKIYADDEKRAIYFQHIAKQEKKQVKLEKKFTIAKELSLSELDYLESPIKGDKFRISFSIPRKIIAKSTIAIFMAIFVLLSLTVYWQMIIRDEGQVAGGEEELQVTEVAEEESATTTLNKIE